MTTNGSLVHLGVCVLAFQVSDADLVAGCKGCLRATRVIRSLSKRYKVTSHVAGDV